VKISLLFLLSLIVPTSNINEVATKGLVHAYHTSITQIEYNTKEKVYEISIRLFTDDLEKTLGQATKNPKLKIINDDKNDGLVSDYFQIHFVITNAQGKKQPVEYIGKENENPATWIYFQLPSNGSLKGFKLHQDVLMETFDDQVNIVNIAFAQQKNSYIFNAKNREKNLL
jgi:hypothetical protein